MKHIEDQKKGKTFASKDYLVKFVAWQTDYQQKRR